MAERIFRIEHCEEECEHLDNPACFWITPEAIWRFFCAGQVAGAAANRERSPTDWTGNHALPLQLGAGLSQPGSL